MIFNKNGALHILTGCFEAEHFSSKITRNTTLEYDLFWGTVLRAMRYCPRYNVVFFWTIVPCLEFPV